MIHARVRLALMVAGTIALVAIAAVVAFSSGEEAARGADLRGAVRPETIRPIDFGLNDQDGKPVTLASMKGKPIVVTFQYTTCKDTCPLTTAQIRGALDELGHDVPVIAVSVDPKNDTVKAAKAFLQKHKMAGRMRWALGNPGRLQRIWRAYGVQPQTEKLEHTASTVLLDDQGRQRAGYATDFLTPDMLADDIATLEGEDQ